MSYFCTPIRIDKSTKLPISIAGEDVGQCKFSFIVSGKEMHYFFNIYIWCFGGKKIHLLWENTRTGHLVMSCEANPLQFLCGGCLSVLKLAFGHINCHMWLWRVLHFCRSCPFLKKTKRKSDKYFFALHELDLFVPACVHSFYFILVYQVV